MAASKRRILLSFVLVLLAAFLIYCVLMLRPRFVYQQGVRALKTNDAASAVVLFERAEAAIPGFLTNRSSQRRTGSICTPITARPCMTLP